MSSNHYEKFKQLNDPKAANIYVSYSDSFSDKCNTSTYKITLHKTGVGSAIDHIEFPYNDDTNVGDYVNFDWLTNLIESKLNLDFLHTRKRSATEEEAERIASSATEAMQDFIYDTYNKYDIQEHGTWLYQRVNEELAEWVNDFIHDYYDFEVEGWEVMYDALMTVILQKVDYDAIYSTFDEILGSPVTMSEKLKDIGMRESDFV